MRRVDRSLHSPDQDWLDRAEKRKHHSKPKGFSDHYRAQTVQVALARLFHGKCSYCEAVNNSLQVEHYRPKAGVAEDRLHEGYYWLAYEWTNLLPACDACNKSLRDRGAPPALGKATQFPLRAESPRARTPSDNLALEQPLLLNPCIDEPNDHLRLLPNGRLEGKSDVGEASIKVYNLNQSTKERRRLMAYKDLMCAHSKKEAESIRRLLGDDRDFCSLLRKLYSDLIGRPWSDYLAELDQDTPPPRR